MINLEAMNDKALKKYIKQTPTQTDRSTLLFGMLFYPIIFIILPLFAPPFHLSYVLLVVPFIILLDIWVLIYRFSKAYHSKKQDAQYFLIRGIFGCVFSFGCFLVSQKFAYTVLLLETPWYFILTLLGYLFVLFLHFRTRLNKLKALSTKKKKQKTGNKIAVVVAASSLGYLVCSIVLRYFSEDIGVIMFMVAMLAISIMLMNFILDLHKYMVIKLHIKKGND